MTWLTDFLQWVEETRADRVAEILSPHVDGSVLDVGCWNGLAVERLQLRSVVGIDVVIPPQPRIRMTRFDGMHVPFSDRSFDTVLCSTALHHAGNPRVLLREMKRVGEKIVVLEDAYDTWMDRASVLALHGIGSRLIPIPHHREGFRSAPTWQSMFEEEGLHVSHFSRHPGIQPIWWFLRNDLYVLTRR